ncbi:prepilin-type N-terminal cleavage/methylation domain-containing protein, partial [Acinetobacter baumannii]
MNAQKGFTLIELMIVV